MTGRARRPLSVRSWLACWIVGVLLLTLTACALLFWYTIRVTLRTAVDREMRSRADRVVRLWDALGSDGRALPRERFAGWLRGLPASSVIRRTASAPYGARALDVQHRDLVTGAPDSPWDAQAFTAAARGGSIYSTVRVDGEPVRILSVPLRRGGAVVGVVQFARSLSETRRAMRTVEGALLAGIPLALLIAWLAGFWLTGRVVKPVREMRQEMERIEASSLSHRLEPAGHDEFAALAATINGMLGRLETAFEQQARFTADASHELRTPLTVMRANTSLALSRPREAEEYRETIERVHRVVESMGRTVEDLLLLARADAGQLAGEREELEMRSLLLSAIEQTPARPDRPIELICPEAGLRVSGNAPLLVRLFANLLANSARHTPPERRIVVRAAACGEVVECEVLDEGEGIAPEHLAHVRERFYQAAPHRSGQPGSTGLGLSICHGIVAAHGGAMEIRSEPEKGTQVIVTLPRA